MDLQHLNRTIEENPIANGLDVFYSFAKQKGVGDIAAVDRIIAKDVQFLASELVVCLRSHPAAKVLQGIQGSVSDDLIALSLSVTTGMVGEDSVRRLLKAAITKADDKTLWDEVLAFITASLTVTTRSIAPQNTPPASTSTAALASIPTISITHDDDLFTGPADSNCPDTPQVRRTSGMVNTSEHHKNIDRLLREELKGRMHYGIPDFLEAFFPSATYQEVAENFLNRCKTVTGVEPIFNDDTHRFESWPDLTNQEQVVPWMKTFIKELEEFSRNSFTTNDEGSHSRALFGLPNQVIKGHVAKRKLDAGFISAADLESGQETLTYFWTTILGSAELKQNEAAERAAELSLAQYARILLTTQGTRRYALGFTLCGSSLRVWLFDRVGGMASRRVDVNKDPLQFIKVMLGFLWMSKEDLGFDPSIRGPDVRSDGADNSDDLKWCIEITKQDGTKEQIVLDELIFKSSCVVGRATTCWKGHVKGHPEEIRIVKDLWANPTRPSEGDMLLLAASRGVVNVARHYHHETVQFDGRDDDILTCVRRGLRKEPVWNTSIRPPSGLRRQETTDTSTKETDSSLHPRKKLRSSKSKKTTTEPENRVHRRLIVLDFGEPIYKASSRKMLLACLEKCIEGHWSLYKAGILHRDISINNLMVREESGMEGFIIDLDLAIEMNRANTVTDVAERSQRTRTGTRAFMAIGILEGETHTFLHDLESFFWVLFWICIHYGKSGEGSRRLPTYEDWNYVDNETLAGHKRNLLTSYKLFEAALEDFVPYYRPLISCICQLRDLLPFVVEAPGNVVRGGKLPKTPRDELYSQMMEVLQEAQAKVDC
ncbi:hypothetical protein E4U48_004343 [Claviceps purpurea]|nr:hypothetical protein E4U48_004343 [Claviceps purpurea]